MTAVQHTPHVDVMVEQDIVTHAHARRGLAALRIAFGATFLWAFLDKLLALGFATGKNPETGAVDLSCGAKARDGPTQCCPGHGY